MTRRRVGRHPKVGMPVESSAARPPDTAVPPAASEHDGAGPGGARATRPAGQDPRPGAVP